MATDERPADLIGYEAMQQDALRGVIRSAIARAAAPGGLPGEHHFYISFRTGAPDVAIPESLRARYPDEMTIVLQHQYWDLNPGESAFSVTLQFNGQPKSLSIPYAAVTRFYDPAVQYMLHFAPPESAPAVDAPAQSSPGRPPERSPSDTREGAPNVVAIDKFRKK